MIRMVPVTCVYTVHAFALASETIAYGQSTVTLSHMGACGYVFLLSVMSVRNRILSAIVRICAYLSVSVRIVSVCPSVIVLIMQLHVKYL